MIALQDMHALDRIPNKLFSNMASPACIGAAVWESSFGSMLLPMLAVVRLFNLGQSGGWDVADCPNN